MRSEEERSPTGHPIWVSDSAASPRTRLDPQPRGLDLAQCALGRLQGLRLRHGGDVSTDAAGDQMQQVGSCHDRQSSVRNRGGFAETMEFSGHSSFARPAG